MAYSTSNPPALICDTLGGGRRFWVYASTDAATAVRVQGYFTNGWRLGMRVGDLVDVIKIDANPPARTLATVVSASLSGVDLSDGTAITATDTD